MTQTWSFFVTLPAPPSLHVDDVLKVRFTGQLPPPAVVYVNLPQISQQRQISW